MKMSRIIAFSLLLGAFSLISCNLEKKVAKSFIQEGKGESILVLKPDFIYKYNLKEFLVDSSEAQDETKRDSLLLARSLFLNKIDDSILINDFTLNFMEELARTGYHVFTDKDFDSLLASNSHAYIANIAQFSVEEYIHPFTNDYIVGSEVVTLQDIDLNALNINVWIELGKLNSDQDNKVLFASDHLFDRINGYFKQYFFSDNITFEYSIDTISMPEIYQFGQQTGRDFAGYLYDYFLNNYIRENMPANYPYEIQYYHYDPSSQNLYIQMDEERKVIELEKDKK